MDPCKVDKLTKRDLLLVIKGMVDNLPWQDGKFAKWGTSEAQAIRIMAYVGLMDVTENKDGKIKAKWKE